MKRVFSYLIAGLFLASTLVMAGCSGDLHDEERKVFAEDATRTMYAFGGVGSKIMTKVSTGVYTMEVAYTKCEWGSPAGSLRATFLYIPKAKFDGGDYWSDKDHRYGFGSDTPTTLMKAGDASAVDQGLPIVTGDNNNWYVNGLTVGSNYVFTLDLNKMDMTVKQTAGVKIDMQFSASGDRGNNFPDGSTYSLGGGDGKFAYAFIAKGNETNKFTLKNTALGLSWGGASADQALSSSEATIDAADTNKVTITTKKGYQYQVNLNTVDKKMSLDTKDLLDQGQVSWDLGKYNEKAELIVTTKTIGKAGIVGGTCDYGVSFVAPSSNLKVKVQRAVKDTGSENALYTGSLAALNEQYNGDATKLTNLTYVPTGASGYVTLSGMTPGVTYMLEFSEDKTVADATASGSMKAKLWKGSPAVGLDGWSIKGGLDGWAEHSLTKQSDGVYTATIAATSTGTNVEFGIVKYDGSFIANAQTFTVGSAAASCTMSGNTGNNKINSITSGTSYKFTFTCEKTDVVDDPGACKLKIEALP